MAKGIIAEADGISRGAGEASPRRHAAETAVDIAPFDVGSCRLMERSPFGVGQEGATISVDEKALFTPKSYEVPVQRGSHSFDTGRLPCGKDVLQLV